MPELPEVEGVRRSLIAPLIGRSVVRVEVRRAEVVTLSKGVPVAQRKVLLLEGGRVGDLLRHGKHLAIVAGDGTAVDVHLGMTGQLLVIRPGDVEPKSHVHVRWALDNGFTMVFRDPRRFGGLWAFSTFDELRATRWASLGPDALGVTEIVLQAALRDTKRAVKGVLLDQTVIAGVGNIYADEALFRAGVRPTKPGRRVRPPEASRLATAIREVLAEAVGAGGSTLRDYRTADGESGSFQNRHRVYGRGGKPCMTCGNPLRSRMVSQRTTVWCSTCQG